ncbi:MAG: 2-oxoacid:acceptor oxidoreductase subunit alpha [Phycisphaerales bacterium]|nr:MAG: 2-oxoacid:acceptor oxidoreductase subunit alpha [Phycisphaerales bacterium]
MSGKSTLHESDVSIVLCGQAGQGIQTVEFLLTRILKIAGFNVFATKEYMSRIRGGANSTQIRVASRKVSAPVNRIDVLVALNEGALQHVAARISRETMVLAEKSVVGDEADLGSSKFIDVPFTETASEIGDKVYANTVAVGTIAGLLGVKLGDISDYIKRFFSAKSSEIVQGNVKSAEAGHKIGRELAASGAIDLDIAADTQASDEILLNGAEAVGLGAIAGGCNFIASYPMSPSTGVLAFLAKHGSDFDIIAEQAEDEIAAINMALGAWYAGARAMVTTSGGGFALMTEGLSLAGMLETPVVIHLAQRPGPATGLPTRTEQGDLELALYAGHGEFPRIIFAPGTLQEAFYLTQKAFNLADKYQVPVFVLTDQYMIDSYYNVPSFNLSDVRVEKFIIKTAADYRRYELTKDGISPRGIPGFGEGLVAVDSDEHDEAGHITEDLDLRVKMVDKRLKRLEAMQAEAVHPELVGKSDYENLLICWGSTYHIAREALAELARDDTALLHCKQVYPLGPGVADHLKKARRTILIEGNATGQFGKLIRLHVGIDVHEQILKYSGLSFTVEEVVNRLETLLA